MINKFLQFIKKQRLAILLAKFDCLFVISGLQAFRYVLPLACLFRQRREADEMQRLYAFLQYSQEPLFFAVYEELASRPDIFALPAHIFPIAERHFVCDELYKTAADSSERKFYTDLFREIIRTDYPDLIEQYKVFEHRLDTIYDMRFLASDIELVCSESAGFSDICPYEVDWQKTTKEKLYLCFDTPMQTKKFLTPAEQQNLSRLFAYLFFERSLFVSYWRNMCTGDDSRVAFLDFDAVYPVTSELKGYLLQMMSNQKAPVRPEEYKLQRAVMVLQEFCPDINIYAAWNEYIDITDFSPRVRSDNDNLLEQLKAGGFDIGQYQPVELPEAGELSYLLHSEEVKKGAQFRKSSVVYWGPLAVLFYTLLYYF